MTSNSRSIARTTTQSWVYIAGIGTITTLGGDTNTSYHAIRADISGYQSVDCFTRQRERIIMALVPDDALPPVTG